MTTTTTMTITNAPEIPGLVFRSFDPEHDFPALVGLMNVCNEADHAEEIITVESMRNFYAHAVNFNPSTDMLLAQVEGYLVGSGRVNWWVNDVGERLYGLNGCIHPEWRGKGIGRALLGWQEAHARELAATHPTTEPSYFQAFVMDNAPATVRLFERAGLHKDPLWFHDGAPEPGRRARPAVARRAGSAPGASGRYPRHLGSGR